MPEKQWEIGLVQSWSGSASKIIGPFDSDKAAADYAATLNEKLPSPAHNGRRWMWALCDEIPKRVDCTVEKP